MKGRAYKKKWVMYPPRAQVSIKPQDLQGGAWSGWIAQPKYNGTRTLIFIMPDGTIELWGRHQEQLKAYKMTSAMKLSIQSLALGPGYHVLDGELMHSKTKGIKDRIVLYDILVLDGRYLIGSSYSERYDTLHRLCGRTNEPEGETGRKIALKVYETLWLAPVFKGSFEEEYQKLIDMDEIEGLVLKDPGGKLEFGVTESNNTDWQIRCRKPHKNYSY